MLLFEAVCKLYNIGNDLTKFGLCVLNTGFPDHGTALGSGRTMRRWDLAVESRALEVTCLQNSSPAMLQVLAIGLWFAVHFPVVSKLFSPTTVIFGVAMLFYHDRLCPPEVEPKIVVTSLFTLGIELL